MFCLIVQPLRRGVAGQLDSQVEGALAAQLAGWRGDRVSPDLRKAWGIKVNPLPRVERHAVSLCLHVSVHDVVMQGHLSSPVLKDLAKRACMPTTCRRKRLTVGVRRWMLTICACTLPCACRALALE